MANCVWVLVNCNSIKEAKQLGNLVLQHRLASCFDIFQRELSMYFWPPKSKKLESAKGALLILETFSSKYKSIHKLISQNHSDKLPFIGYISINGLSKRFLHWMKSEIK